MIPKQKQGSESQAIAVIDTALENLPDEDSRARVLVWAVAKYGGAMRNSGSTFTHPVGVPISAPQSQTLEGSDAQGPRARAWIKKHNITSQALDAAFHIEGDSSTLIVKSIKGSSKSEKLRNIAALLGAMALIKTDQPKFTSEEFREALKQYDAYDTSNNPANVKRNKDVIQGSASTGYTTTSVGLDLAASLLTTPSSE